MSISFGTQRVYLTRSFACSTVGQRQMADSERRHTQEQLCERDSPKQLCELDVRRCIYVSCCLNPYPIMRIRVLTRLLSSPIVNVLAFSVGGVTATARQTSDPIVFALGVVRDPAIRYTDGNGQTEARSSYYWTSFSSVHDVVSVPNCIGSNGHLLRVVSNSPDLSRPRHLFYRSERI